MTSTYRDDLEAALQRTDDLEREAAELRARNERVAAELANGDRSEATAELAARIAQERAMDEYRNRPTELVATRGGRLVASSIIGFFTIMIAGNLFAEHMYGTATVMATIFGGFVAWLNLIPRVDPPGRFQ